MKWMTVFFILIGCLAYKTIANNCKSCTCSESKSSRIIGGTQVPDQKYSWMVQVVSHVQKGTFACGGSVINDRYVLTAAHCLIRTAENTTVTSGITNLDDKKNAMIHKVEKLIIHENWKPHINFKNDIALVKLKNSINLSTSNRVSSICLAPQGASYIGETGTAIGWGFTKGTGSPSNDLLEVSLPIVSDSECQRTFGRTYFPDKMICYGISSGDEGACRGDSGSPLQVVNKASGVILQVGIVSFGYPKCDSYSVFTEVNKFIDWINEHTADACKCKRPAGTS